MFKKRFLFLCVVALSLTACSTWLTTPAANVPRKLRVMTHDSFAISEEVIAEFEQTHEVQVEFLKSGDTGTAVNKAILSKGNPLADVFYGVDNTFLSRALIEGIFIPYRSPGLSSVPEDFQLDPTFHALPVDFGDVCINYDRAYFSERNLNPPDSLEDLTSPPYKNMLVVQNPATSSPGLAFLLATIGRFGEDGYLIFWQDLVANGVKIVNDWESAYYGEFSVHGGGYPLVVSYGSSPPAEVIFAETPISEPPTGVVSDNLSCFRQVEFVGILAGTENEDIAKEWVDFMLSTTFQQDMPMQMFVFPVNKEAKLPPTFEQFTVIPKQTAFVSPDDIRVKREAWLEAWTNVALR